MNHLNGFVVRYSCNDPWLDSKMYQITMCMQHQLFDKQYSITSIDNFNQLKQHVKDSKWMLVQMAGDYIVDRDHIWNKLHSIPDDVGMIGHLLWNPGDQDPYLHKQCLIINSKAIEDLNFDFYQSKITGKNFLRSDKSMHGDYCPAEVMLGETESTRSVDFGTAVMQAILSKGYKVLNFDEHWRSNINLDYISHLPSRGYLNPDINTTLFSECFKSLTIHENLDPAQKDAIETIKHELEYHWVNVYHWDAFPTNQEADIIIAPASGFLGECMAMHNNCKKIIFYDINANNIDFKRKLYSEWDGKNYESYYANFANERNLNIDPQTPQAKETAKKHFDDVNNVIEKWDIFKQYDVEFLNIDIIDCLDLLLSKVKNKSILHTSTILNFYIWSNIKHDREKIEIARNKIQEKIERTDSIWYEAY